MPLDGARQGQEPVGGVQGNQRRRRGHQDAGDTGPARPLARVFPACSDSRKSLHLVERKSPEDNKSHERSTFSKNSPCGEHHSFRARLTGAAALPALTWGPRGTATACGAAQRGACGPVAGVSTTAAGDGGQARRCSSLHALHRRTCWLLAKATRRAAAGGRCTARLAQVGAASRFWVCWAGCQQRGGLRGWGAVAAHAVVMGAGAAAGRPCAESARNPQGHVLDCSFLRWRGGRGQA